MRALAANVRGWVAVCALGIVVWPLVVCAPFRWRWAILVRAGRVLAATAGVDLAVRAQRFAPGRCYVANHASYIDGLVLVLALERPAVLVVGGKLRSQLIAGQFLRSLGAEFVGRDSGRSIHEQLARLEEHLRAGRDLAGFPEGGLGDGAIRRMHLGLFLAAARAGAPVVPVAISGSAAIVRPGAKHIAAGRVEVHVGGEILPEGSDSRAARQMADRTSAQLAQLLRA